MPTLLRLCVVPALVLGLATPAVAAPAAPSEIRFPAGQSSTTLHGGLARGETARYTFGARADQWVELTLRSIEDNAVARIYAPGWRIGGDGAVVPGDTDAELGDAAETKHWATLLPASGTYLVELGSERGGAEWDLELALRAPAPDDCRELPQQPMNACFAAVASAADAARAEAYAKLEAVSDAGEKRHLAAAEQAWSAYRRATCEYEAARYEGGSLQPTVFGDCMARLATVRRGELESALRSHEEQ